VPDGVMVTVGWSALDHLDVLLISRRRIQNTNLLAGFKVATSHDYVCPFEQQSSGDFLAYE